MRYLVILLIFTESLFSQNSIIEYQILETISNQKGFRTYSFDSRGYPIQITRKNSEDRVDFEIKIEYDGELTNNITFYHAQNSLPEKKLKFMYDQNKRLIAQKWSNEDSPINLIYDAQNRLIKMENYNESDVSWKYDSLNRIEEEFGKSIQEETIDYFDVTTFTYAKNKTIKIKTFNSPYDSSTATTTYEYHEGKLVKEIGTNSKNDLTIVTEYEYSPIGILTSEITMNGINEFKVITKNQDLKKEVIEEINKILIGDFSSINGY